MPVNPLIALQQFGQSVWLDNIRRGMFASGELARLIREDGVRGVTSNPTIFEKAITGSADYDEALRRLAREGRSTADILDTLIVEDIQRAADLFRPLYDRTQGQDGFVSFEVAPRLARDTQTTLQEARRLWRLVARPNIMVKIPGTREGLPAIRQAIAEGCNINITLLFAIERYAQVIDAYFAGLEQRARDGAPIRQIASVASFFVSRVDTSVDQLLEAKRDEALAPLIGQAAIANAKLAYHRFTESLRSPRFQALKAKGAQVQRVLWASTSTKNPAYRDVRYVEELIGEHTVNTMPEATLAAFRDHGRAAATIEHGIAEAQAVFARLAEAGLDLSRVTADLEDAGVKAFADSFDALARGVEAKRELVLT